MCRPIAIICGFTAANMYYIQPLIPIIRDSLLVSYEKTSMLYSVKKSNYVMTIATFLLFNKN
ncbi:hypothetical protein XIS1_150015 [Xenorhabdus innexi]|uniref:Uncharacterized protein n=1 Tax=Xenorhabdus innexi TaxID=290109 RepID=A0A1N6MUK5_9GAMM|nr:hypothetical protein XIS1_150015 [Xenorhabdus innexi]